MNKFELASWKENEYDYCRNLVVYGPTPEVPFKAIPSYLEAQCQMAIADGRHDVAKAIADLIVCHHILQRSNP